MVTGGKFGLNLDSLGPDYRTDESLRFNRIGESGSYGNTYMCRKELSQSITGMRSALL